MPYSPPYSADTDFELFDGVHSVGYTRRGLDGSASASYQGVRALRRSPATADASAGGEGRAVRERAAWHLRASTLPVKPRRGDTFVSPLFGTWEVLEVSLATLGTRWALQCQRVSDSTADPAGGGGYFGGGYF